MQERNRDGIWEKVCTLMYLGYAPSFIDKVLGLPKGKAHDMVVDCWASEHGYLPKGHDPQIEDRYPKLWEERHYMYTHCSE